MNLEQDLLGSDLGKMMLFMFLGLIVAILVLGFHKSPQASATLGAAERAAQNLRSSGTTAQGNQNIPTKRNNGGFY